MRPDTAAGQGLWQRKSTTLRTRLTACSLLRNSDCDTALPLADGIVLRHPRWDHVRSINIDQIVGTNHRVATTRPLLEDDLVTVIAELKSSTAAIQKQADLLRRHREQRLRNTSQRLPRRSGRPPGDSDGHIGRKDVLALQQLRLALGEAKDALTSCFQSASEEALHTKKATERRLVQLLHDDDQKLKALQKLALPSDAVPGTEIDSNQRTSCLFSKLVGFTCEEIKFRLDRIYLEQLHGYAAHENDFEEAAGTQEISLKSDLDTLYTEIRDVVAISVSQELEYPIRNSRLEDSRRQRTSQNLAGQCVSYINSSSIIRLDDCRFAALSPNPASSLKTLPTISSS